MPVNRTIQLNDISPLELADMFTAYTDRQQAEFFDHIHDITREWPGTGWCQQALEISKRLTWKGREIIGKLASHSSDERPVDLAAIAAWVRGEATFSLGQHNESECTALTYIAEEIETGNLGKPRRNCDDCDFATPDPDLIVCPECKGLVG